MDPQPWFLLTLRQCYDLDLELQEPHTLIGGAFGRWLNDGRWYRWLDVRRWILVRRGELLKAWLRRLCLPPWLLSSPLLLCHLNVNGFPLPRPFYVTDHARTEASKMWFKINFSFKLQLLGFYFLSFSATRKVTKTGLVPERWGPCYDYTRLCDSVVFGTGSGEEFGKIWGYKLEEP